MIRYLFMYKWEKQSTNKNLLILEVEGNTISAAISIFYLILSSNKSDDKPLIYQITKIGINE